MSYNTPENLYYTKEHEWALINGDVATIGITDFAQAALGDIVYVELPEVGSTLNISDSFGVVESIKSVSDLYSPLTGEIIEVNEELSESPQNCNESPYEAWIMKLKISNSNEIEKLLNFKNYQTFCESKS